MADDTATDGQIKSGISDDAEAEKQTSGKKGTPTDDEQAATDKGQKTFTQDDLDRIVNKRLRKAEEAWEKNKDLSEVERLKTENESLQKQVQSNNAFAEFEIAVSKHGVKNVRGLYRAMQGDIALDKAGKIEDLAGLVKQAKSELPEFFATANLGDGDGGKGDDGKKKAMDMNSLIRSRAGRS